MTLYGLSQALDSIVAQSICGFFAWLVHGVLRWFFGGWRRHAVGASQLQIVAFVLQVVCCLSCCRGLAGHSEGMRGMRVWVGSLRWLSFAVLAVMAAVVGLDCVAPPHADADTPVAAGEYIPVTSTRLMDTRTSGGALAAGETRNVTVTGVAGVPTSGVSAVSLTIGGTGATADTFFTAFAAGATRPGISQLNVPNGVSASNAAIVPVGANGQVSVYNYTGSAHLIVDINGYYDNNQATSAGGTFVPVNPSRIVDSRSGTGTSATKWAAGETRAVQVAGQGGIPTSGVSAVVVNITAAQASAASFLRAWGAGSAPSTSVLNMASGQDAGAMVQTGLTSDGKLNIYNNAGTTHVMVDVEGYYLTPDHDAQNYFVPIAPTRILATSVGLNVAKAKMTPGSSVTVPVRGVSVNSSTVVPNNKNVAAVVVSLTEAHNNAGGNMTAYPTDQTRPNTSVLNYQSGDGMSGTAIVKIGADGNIAVYSSGGSPDLYVDVQGYFTSTPPPAVTTPTVSVSGLSNSWAATGTSVGLSASSSGPAGYPVTQYRYAVDDPSMSSPKLINVTNNATGTATIAGLADGWHTVYVQAYASSGNISDTKAVSFGVGVAATSPVTGAASTKYVTLSGRAPGSYVSVKWRYRRAAADAWTDIPAAQVTNAGSGIGSWPVSSGGSSSNGWVAPSLVWDAATTLGNDGSVLVAPCYYVSGGGSEKCLSDAAAPTVTLDRLGTANTDASTSLGDGSLDLLTGNLTISGSDANLTGAAAALSISRTFNTLAPTRAGDTATGKASIFGTGWTTALGVDSAGSDWTGLSDRGTSVVAAGSDGSLVTFAKNSSGTYLATGDDADDGYTLTAGAAGTNGPVSWTISDLDGNATVFAAPSGGYGAAPSPAAAHAYAVSSVTQPGSAQITTYTYDSSGRPTRMLAPQPAGANCASSWVAGCQALDLSYDSNGHLSKVVLDSFDAGAALSIAIACYTYDSSNRLSQEWDPRNGAAGASASCGSPVQPTGYGYDSNGRLSAITPPGLAAYQFGYDSTGRLTTVSRTHNSANGGGTQTTTVVYGVPTTADSANPAYRPDLSSTAIAAWAQATAPVTATAIFTPGHTASSTDLRGAEVSYLNADGRTVNTADYAGTDASGWNITTTDYDTHGNVVRSLSAANRNTALGAGDPDSDYAGYSTQAAAMLLSSTSTYVYDANGVGDLTDTYGPATTDSGVTARAHTHTSYDTGSETAHPAGGVLHLPVSSTSSSQWIDTDGTVHEDDPVVTTTDYALSSSDATGWTFRSPMRVTVDPSGLNIQTVTRYDPTTGASIESRQPKSSGSDAGTTDTVYYTAGSNTSDAACGNKPAWVGLTCTTGPAAQPGVSGMPGIPTTRISNYDYLGRATSTTTSVTDASGATKTKTSTVTYSDSGYGNDPVTSSTTGGLGAAVPAVTTSYDASTGLATGVSAAATATQASTASSTSYDDFGNVTSYNENTSASGNNANTVTTSYDTAGRVASVKDAHGTTSYTYNQNGEYRDQATSETVTGLGTITATYDADGNLNSQTLPNGQTTTTVMDSTGFTTWRRTLNGGRIWLSEYLSADSHGRTASDVTSGAAGYTRWTGYTYDNAGRLTHVGDATSGQGCYERDYGFDKNSNRTSQAVYGPDNSATYWLSSCQHTTTASSATHTYDTADRLQATGSDTGLVYDAFGRITTLPAADAPNSSNGNVTSSYYANDLVRSMTQNGTTTTWALDASGRFASYVTTGTGAGTKTNHYDDGAGDSPDWIAENADASNYTRNVTGLDGNLVATIDQAGTATYQITNEHGDVTATATAGDTDPSNYYLTDEAGNAVGTSSDPSRYGPLGADERSIETPAALTLMGARLYSPVLGSFLSVDSVRGGNATPYGYPTDPTNNYDVTGTSQCSQCEGGGGALNGFHMRHSWHLWGLHVLVYLSRSEDDWIYYHAWTIGVAITLICGAIGLLNGAAGLGCMAGLGVRAFVIIDALDKARDRGRRLSLDIRATWAFTWFTTGEW